MSIERLRQVIREAIEAAGGNFDQAADILLSQFDADPALEVEESLLDTYFEQDPLMEYPLLLTDKRLGDAVRSDLEAEAKWYEALGEARQRRQDRENKGSSGEPQGE